MAGRLSDGERPSAAPASTEDRAAQLTRRSREGGQVLALTLADVGNDLGLGRDSVGLEGQVVVGNVLVLALHSLEKLVGSLLNSVGDLDQHGLLLSSEVGAGTLGHSVGLGLTLLDSLGDRLLHVRGHGSVLVLDQLAVLLASLLVVTDDTSQHLKVLLHLLVVGSNHVGERV